MKKNYKSLEISNKKKISGDFSGIFRSFLKGSGTDFDSLSEYNFGDSIKNIDWKTTAKQNKAFIKKYDEEKDLKVFFFMKNSPSLNFGSERKTKKNLLEEIFYILSYSCISNGYSVGTFFGDNFSDYKKNESIIINTLDNINKNSVYNSRFNFNLKDNLIFYISDGIDIDMDFIRSLNFKNELIFINIFDYFENNLSKYSFDTNISSIKSTFCLFSNKKNKDSYLRSRKNTLLSIKSYFYKYKIPYIKIDSKDDVFMIFYKFFNEYKT